MLWAFERVAELQVIRRVGNQQVGTGIGKQIKRLERILTNGLVQNLGKRRRLGQSHGSRRIGGGFFSGQADSFVAGRFLLHVLRTYSSPNLLSISRVRASRASLA